MPGYVVEFESSFGPERRLFTLDENRALHPQLTQVLEELRQSDRVVEGGPDDTLAAYWNGEELDLTQTLATVGATTQRPLVLRMRPKPVAVAATVVRTQTVDWKRVILPSIEGAIGAVLAWFASWRLADIRLPLRTSNQVDLGVSVVLVTLIAFALFIGMIRRNESTTRAVLPWLVLIPACGMATALGIKVMTNTPDVGQFLLGRAIAWGVMMTLLSLLTTAPLRNALSNRFLWAPLIGASAGIASAMVYSLPGPSLFLQAMAFAIAGAGVGIAAVGVPVWQAQFKQGGVA